MKLAKWITETKTSSCNAGGREKEASLLEKKRAEANGIMPASNNLGTEAPKRRQ